MHMRFVYVREEEVWGISRKHLLVTESNEGIEAGLIHKYFTEGHAYEVILDFLEKRHNIVLSLRTLKRRLQNAGLTRRTDYTPIGTVHQTVAHELRGSGRLLGYRAMWQTLQQKYHLTVKREDVRQTISRLDPSGVQLRSRRRFVRRGYVTAGPNQVWHADGYDKLKPFGIAISGCIDGFSRKVMWLRSGSTNNDPGIIAQYYLQCVSEFGLLPAKTALWQPLTARYDLNTQMILQEPSVTCMVPQLQTSASRVGGLSSESNL
ncbi:uncharacterized protein LOC117532424 [Gymnodraco acuticeps]|uniref:Uncharacterized protein LOC117532424 n=1 Tax=Gymnodraco acuticeps TaxID=8218 RepID=A0A6P8SVI2_GYMAC|nr:uncharacterized protein LOC117532424 [Gymnodraco acuticeps]